MHAATTVSGSTAVQSVGGATLSLPVGDFGDDLRRMNAERVQLDEELRESENKEIKIFVDQYVCFLFISTRTLLHPLLSDSFLFCMKIAF